MKKIVLSLLFSALLMGLPLVSFAGPATDTDSDGVIDVNDNCSEKPNPIQFDSNGDGFGNQCDADYDNNGGVGASDFTILSGQFGKTIATDPNTFDIDVDCEANLGIGASDFACLSAQFGGPPGPSGLWCADPTGATAPCLSPNQ